jgi:hypothetical protein
MIEDINLCDKLLMETVLVNLQHKFEILFQICVTNALNNAKKHQIDFFQKCVESCRIFSD